MSKVDQLPCIQSNARLLHGLPPSRPPGILLKVISLKAVHRLDTAAGEHPVVTGKTGPPATAQQQGFQPCSSRPQQHHSGRITNWRRSTGCHQIVGRTGRTATRAGQMQGNGAAQMAIPGSGGQT